MRRENKRLLETYFVVLYKFEVPVHIVSLESTLALYSVGPGGRVVHVHKSPNPSSPV
jgi:hypothetical protein